MSSKLYWRPKDKGDRLSIELKFVLNNIWGSPLNRRILTSNDICMLTAIIAATSSETILADCNKLLEAISAHAEIELFEA